MQPILDETRDSTTQQKNLVINGDIFVNTKAHFIFVSQAVGESLVSRTRANRGFLKASRTALGVGKRQYAAGNASIGGARVKLEGG